MKNFDRTPSLIAATLARLFYLYQKSIFSASPDF